MQLTPAWTKFKPHSGQNALWHSKARFIVLPCGRRCLEAGMLVATPHGPRAIEDLRVGDDVFGFENGRAEITQVEAVWDNGIQEVYPLGNENDKYLACTKEHKLLVCEHGQAIKRSILYAPVLNVCCEQGNVLRLWQIGEPYLAYTYDITVANSTNLYILHDGGIVTSNSGKSAIAKRKLVLSALNPNSGYPDANYFAAAPVQQQAERIYWKDLIKLIPKNLVIKISKSDHSIELYNGATIYVIGMDKPERVEGVPWNGCILDEYANMKKSAWTENVRPALADRNGWAWLIGVPEGRNHYYELYQFACDPENHPEWAAFTWPSADILSPEEIKSAKESLDELTFRQEMMADFVTFEGRCYYPFLRETHCRPLRQLYNPKGLLAFCFDFNVDPGVAAICQEVKLPNGLEGTAIIGEVYIPRNSNTPAVCRKLIQDWGKHEGRIICYGDATGGSRGSAKVQGSDWDLIKAEFRQSPFRDKIDYDVPQSNPPERVRVNAVNSRLKSENGDIRLMVDPEFAPHVVKDFEGVILLKGGSGEIDKKATPELTHMCFCAGTKIITDKGAIEIEKAIDGGLVRSWAGQFEKYEGPYLAAKNVNVISVCICNGNMVTCTPEHSFLTSEGWVCAQNLEGRILMTPELLLYVVKQSRCFKDTAISELMEKRGISAVLQILANSIYTELSGYITMGQFQTDFTFTTLTEIEQIIRLKISQLLMGKNIYQSIIKTLTRNCLKSEDNGFYREEKRPQNGMEAKQGEHGIKNTQNAKKLENIKKYVQYAEKNLCQHLIKPFCVAKTVRQSTGIIKAWMMRSVIASIVEAFFSQINIQKHDFVAGNALQRITQIKDAPKQDVYCITVPDTGCFCLENGAIVSNSDAFGYYIARKFPIVKPSSAMITLSSAKSEYYI